MVWILIILSAILLWLVSLARIIRQLPYASVDPFVNEDGISPRNIMLLIAHPDDESMFFTPTINYLISRGHNMYILCISTGDADGLGSIRKNELYLASAVLKISPHQVKILDHPDLQDGFGETWNWDLLAKIIGDEARANSIDMVLLAQQESTPNLCCHGSAFKSMGLVRKLFVTFSSYTYCNTLKRVE